MPQAQVKAVRVALSPASHVTGRSLKETFGQVLTKSGFKNIDLSVDILDIEIICKSCDNRMITKFPLLNCPRCRSSDLEIILPQREFFITSIELNK
jgi:Zn finger protein HypA/HybF involved in hydrogenase expression